MNGSLYQNLTNQFLIAMPHLEDSYFSRTVTLICQHDANGALGVVVNRTLDSLSVRDILREFNLPDPGSTQLTNTPIYVGGPVHNELGLVLHKDLGRWQSTLRVGTQLGLTSSRDVLEAISISNGPDDCLLVLGYAGWAAGQLDFEIQQNSWLNVPADPRIIFDVDVEQRWGEAVASLGIDIATLTQEFGHA
ncbi:MAG: YqgE/AlgH family protein [Acidiferrobacteraceae bacterium]|nr:YqgE/AlgH family protein [Acidiferrobacteraceae bacterium]